MAVQSNFSVTGGTISSGTCTFTGAQTAGHSNIVFVIAISSNVLVPATVTDFEGNTYTQRTIFNGGPGGFVVWAFTATGIKAAAPNVNVVNVQLNAAINFDTLDIIIIESTANTFRAANATKGGFSGTTASTTVAGTVIGDDCFSITLNQAESTIPSTGLFGTNAGASVLSFDDGANTVLCQEGTSSGGSIAATAGIVSASQWVIDAVAMYTAPTTTNNALFFGTD